MERLTALELASGIVTGAGPAPLLAPGETSPVETSPAEMLCAAVLPALRDGPCLVSFSGGIDSSLVLAAAVRAAREHGLPAPIPVTWTFHDAPAADETRWQEQVVAELGISDWERVEAAEGELDLIGPVATEVLARHGVLQPANAFLHLPLLRRAAPGTLLTGVGGDQVLGLWRWREAAAVLRRERPLRPATALAVGLSRAPLAVRARVELHRDATASPWLRIEADVRVRRAIALEVAAEPARWDRRLPWRAARRELLLGVASLERLAADAGATVSQPLLHPAFLAALARAGGRHGAGSRADTTVALLGELLPSVLRQRRGKAHFDEVFWRAGSRVAMRSWDGEGVDRSLVDPLALMRVWRGPQLHPRTAFLLQQVWLAQHAPAAS